MKKMNRMKIKTKMLIKSKIKKIIKKVEKAKAKFSNPNPSGSRYCATSTVISRPPPIRRIFSLTCQMVFRITTLNSGPFRWHIAN